MLKNFRAGALLALLALLWAAPAHAQGCGPQNPNCIVPTAPPGTSDNRAASTAFVQGAVASPATPATVPHGGTGQSSFTPNLPLIGNGAAPIAQGTRSGNTTNFATSSGGLTPGNCVKIDANGNFVDNGGACGSGGGNAPHTQDFLAGIGFTAGVTTALTLSSAPSGTDLLIITFDGIGQNANTWSLAGAIVTFNAVIPLNTQVVEAKWSTSTTLAGVSSIVVAPSTLTGSVTLVPGPTTSITPSGQNITIGNNISVVSIMDTAFGAKCNAVIVSTGTVSIASGSPNLTVTAAAFTSADVGKSMWVPGAGAAGAGLSTTILTFTDATHVVLAANAGTTVTAVALTQASFVVYGTDDTAAINAAIQATPPFGTLIINPTPFSFPVRGCLIKQSGATGRSLLVDRPINIKGGGNSSALITDPSMGNTVINIHALQSGVTWKGIRWEGFLLGTDTNFTNFPRYGAHGIWFDATTAGPGGFQGINIGPNLSLGENGSGFYSLVLDGVGSQGNRIENNFIVGGIKLDATADSNMILNNRLLGVSTFGIRIDTPGAGNLIFSGNSTTLAAGVCILNGSAIDVSNNFFEEQTASVQYPRNNFLDIGCGSGQAMSSVWVHNNLILSGLSSTSTPIRIDAAVTSAMVYANEIVTSTARAGVSNGNATTVCAPNQYVNATPHFSGTAPINWGPPC